MNHHIPSLEELESLAEALGVGMERRQLGKRLTIRLTMGSERKEFFGFADMVRLDAALWLGQIEWEAELRDQPQIKSTLSCPERAWLLDADQGYDDKPRRHLPARGRLVPRRPAAE